MEREEFFYSRGARIAAVLHVPDDLRRDEVRSGIVLCQGLGGIKEHGVSEFARVLVNLGYVVIRFDYAGFGASEGEHGDFDPTRQVENARDAVTFLSTQAECAADRIALLGASFGGSTAIGAAAVDQRVKAVVAIVAVGSGRRWLKSLRRYWEWDEFVERLDVERQERVRTGEIEWVDPDEVVVPDPETVRWHDEVNALHPSRVWKMPLSAASRIMEFSPESLVHLISPRPLLIVHATRDRLVPFVEGQELFDAARDPKELVAIPKLGHQGLLTGDGFDLLIEQITPWLQRNFPAVSPST